MTKFKEILPPMNLRLFDGAGGEGAPSTGAEGQGTETNPAGEVPPAAGEEGNPHAAGATPQEGAEPAEEDRETAFINRIKGEDREFFEKEFNKRAQRMINRRFKETKELEKNAQTVAPLLKALATNYDADPNDLPGLVEKVLGSDRLYEDRARANGLSVEAQKAIDKLTAENEVFREQELQRQQNELSQKILNGWNTQAEEFREKVPEFDLESCMDNERFYDLITRGYSVEHAYNCAFPKEYEKRITASVEKRITDNIRARGMRPSENGVTPTANANGITDTSKFSDSDFKALIQRASRGEKIIL